MISLSRRLQRLEADRQQNAPVAADRRRCIQQRAIRRLTTEELRCLIEVKKALPEGRAWTSQELAALNALKTATEEECRKARITVAEFNRYSSAATPAGR
jgi:Lon protease-like protein